MKASRLSPPAAALTALPRSQDTSTLALFEAMEAGTRGFRHVCVGSAPSEFGLWAFVVAVTL